MKMSSFAVLIAAALPLCACQHASDKEEYRYLYGKNYEETERNLNKPYDAYVWEDPEGRKPTLYYRRIKGQYVESGGRGSVLGRPASPEVRDQIKENDEYKKRAAP